jgi:hypothetical protein
MWKKPLLYVLVALMLVPLAGRPAQTQSEPRTPLKKPTCPELWPVQQNSKWGYIDKTGKLTIPFKFDAAADFAEGLAAVEFKEKTGYINPAGKFVIPPRFLAGFSFADGLAVVVIRRFEQDKLHMNEFVYIDKSGKTVLQPHTPLDTKSFRISYRDGDLTFTEGLLPVEQNGKSGYMDRTGKTVIPPRYDAAQSFSEGLAAVKLEGQYGYIDRSGKMVIPPRFKEAAPFSEGLASILSDRHQGYIDKSGQLVIDGPKFDMARSFSEGRAAVKGENGKYGFIDRTGKFVIPPRFWRVGDFSEGLAAVQPESGDLAYINSQGEMVIKSLSTLPNRPSWAEFDLHYYRFCGGVARVGLGNAADLDAEGYINREGKFIWPKPAPSKPESR